MNSLAHVLFPENILLGLNARDRSEAFAQVADRLGSEHRIDRSLIYQGLCEREQRDTTAIGQGIAIPHARVKGLHRPMAAFVRLRYPLDFDAPDEQPVSELFVLLLPGNATYEHLQILADIAELACDPHFREQLHAANDLQTMTRLFTAGVEQ